MMDNEWWIDFVAGWVSGAVSVVACQPLDTILTRLQAGGNVLVVVQPVQAAGVQAAAGVTASATVAGAGAGAGTTASLSISTATITGRTLISNFGIRSLWKGSSPMIGAVPFQNALLMGGYGFGKRYADNSNNSNNGNSNNSNTLLPVFIGGCIGGILQSFLMSPIEWIKVNQQTSITAISTSSNNTAGTTVMKQFLNNKSNLWNRGLTATLLRDGIPHGCWFASYEYCKTIMSSSSSSEIYDYEASSNKNDSDSSSSSSSSSFYKTVTVPVVSGAIAATAAWVSLHYIYCSRFGSIKNKRPCLPVLPAA
jgi:solute carrier family 25 carnitine/acylcarnitine transporter 20/29